LSDPNVSHRVYWRDTELISPGPQLAEDIECDVCIVGGGYTGLWSAYFIKAANPSLDVHVLEAAYAGAGASGHNDGFVTGAIGGHSALSLARRCGADQAAAASAAVARSVKAISRFPGEHGFDVELVPFGFYLVATSRRQDRRLREDHERAKMLNPAAAYPPVLDAAAMRARIGSPAITSGTWKAGLLVNPHKLARGLARCVVKAGVTIHEQTPVTGLRDNAGAVMLRTPRAAVRAGRALLAVNAWQEGFAGFQRKVLPVWHYALVTMPLADRELSAIGWPRREGFIEVRRPGVFGRLTADNRILFGGGRVWQHRGADASPVGRGARNIETMLRKQLARYFPVLRDLQVSHFYGGAMGASPDQLPSVGWLSPRVAYAYGYSGNGIPVSHTVGKLVRDLILDQAVPDWATVFIRPDDKRFPPLPLTVLAGKSRSYMSRVIDG
jgi:glycine/D-amino acid oxidase-like deaminating enzyme